MTHTHTQKHVPGCSYHGNTLLLGEGTCVWLLFACLCEDDCAVQTSVSLIYRLQSITDCVCVCVCVLVEIIRKLVAIMYKNTGKGAEPVNIVLI